MLLQDTIGEHLLKVDKAAREREEMILKQLEEKEPLSDKEADQIASVPNRIAAYCASAMVALMKSGEVDYFF